MRRLFPQPLLSLAIAVFWLLLNDAFTPADLLWAALLAFALPPLARTLSPLASAAPGRVPSPARAGSPGVVLALMVTVIIDVVRSNIEVALLVLGPQARLRSRFIVVPCALDDPRAVAILAGIVTMTPGTLSVDIGEDLRTITIHSLHAPDPQLVIDSIRTRYEQPLARIFAC